MTLHTRLATCMDVHMDTNRKPRQKAPVPGQSSPRGSLRRRVVFELEEGQLPLLEQAETRHGSKRAALLAALDAEARAAELVERAERAEAELERQARGTQKAEKGKALADTKLKRDLEAAKRRLANAEAAAIEVRESGADEAAELRRQMEALGEQLAEWEEEVAELRPHAIDWLYCQRCGEWAGPEDWEWREFEEGGSYCFHAPCDDHGDERKGSSWLAQRS
jgi:hypothetical protein